MSPKFCPCAIWINSEKIKSNSVKEKFNKLNGVIVPGGFGERGIKGKLLTISYLRKNRVPFLGICLGLQLAIIEFAQNVLNIKGANSSEFGPCDEIVIGLLTEWNKSGKKIRRHVGSDKGGTMRLGSYPCDVVRGSKAFNIYKKRRIEERHRHRYEVNSIYESLFNEKGLYFSGKSPDGKLPEIIEIKTHPWFLGVQFHPELKSRPFDPHPIFKSFIEATIKNVKKS